MNWPLPNFIRQKRRSSGSSIPGLNVEKKGKNLTVLSASSGLSGNLVSNLVAYLPGGLHLKITIKLLDDDLGFSCANSLVIHEGSLSTDAGGNVVWGLESDNSWAFVFGEPDEVIMRNAVRQESLPNVSHEIQYGLKKFSWESFGSLFVRVSNFTSVLQELMRDLGYPERKSIETTSYWMSRLELTNPSHVEIRVLYHPTYFHGASILLESTGEKDISRDATYEVEITRILLGFLPMQCDADHEETLCLRLGDMARIRERGIHRSTLASTQPNAPKGTETIRIFEAGGMIVHDYASQCPQRKLKIAHKDERRPEGNNDFLNQATHQAWWICCNPKNLQSHSKIGQPISVRVCVECSHDKCAQCLANGGVTRNSIGGREVHSINPVEKYGPALLPIPLEPIMAGKCLDEKDKDNVLDKIAVATGW
ncbi:hypothetical protein FN846DRAFT_889871 [Sphaerosporella brunnea]|uniref:Uncharacterized protein n=1 Tax=Sphaerosporella brunnea TaxID=1250544 RepID=A0A5J5EXY0_9PEZI|nr:hypothetical protein FN846DRAFT_889871 [Sphaerosporella brunnea]